MAHSCLSAEGCSSDLLARADCTRTRCDYKQWRLACKTDLGHHEDRVAAAVLVLVDRAEGAVVRMWSPNVLEEVSTGPGWAEEAVVPPTSALRQKHKTA